jgi:adhesin transport system membrane fusion protein
MLNISDNSIRNEVPLEQLDSLNSIKSSGLVLAFRRWLIAITLIGLVILFLPWTQNVRGSGAVTTLYPDQRVQGVQSTIDGRIDLWYVNEGDTVDKGDTIVRITEIKDAYFDPKLLERTRAQINAKSGAVDGYQSKIEALERQIVALDNLLEVKTQQLVLKIKSDSMNFVAANIEQSIAEIQYLRADTLFSEGLNSRAEWEQKMQKWQRSNAYAIKAENDWQQRIAELASTQAEYAEKRAKAESEYYATKSMLENAKAELAKLENALSNYEVRQSLYIVRAPKRGVVSRIFKRGLGENVKAGEELGLLIPITYEMAVEIFVQPVDLPLLKLNQHARIEFDGWPSIVFSGWPNTSFGTFGAQVFAIDNQVDEKGRYRVLLRPSEDDLDWPNELRFGAGAEGMLLLNDVPVWYEIWRQINGFPPEYYTGANLGKAVEKE